MALDYQETRELKERVVEITVRGDALEVGLKAMDGDVRQVAATSLR